MDDGPQVCSFDYKLTHPTTLDDTPKTFSVCKINEIMDTLVIIKVGYYEKFVIARVMELV
jgi:hypothetical protein